MAKLYNGMIPFASAIKPTGGQPLDDRTVVQSFADLLAEDTFGLAKYNGMLVAVIADEQVYMLVDETNSTSEEAWVAVGSGNGSLAVETYGEAVALATNDNIGQVIYVKTKSSYDADGEEGEGVAIEYDAAPYIVIGAGQLQKLAASTASGDLDSDVAALKTKVATLEGEMDAVEGRMDTAEADIKALQAIDHEAYVAADAELKSELEGKIAEKVDATEYEAKVSEIEEAIAAADTTAKGYADAAQAAAEGVATEFNTAMDERVKVLEDIDHEAYVAADAELKSELEGKIAEKVDAVDGSRLMTDAEGVKLAGIAEGAQVNKLEVVKVNGQALTIADADKSVDIIVPTAPVQGVADGDKLISLDGDKLKSTLTLAYVPATDSDHAVLRLQGINGAVISSIDATAFVKDGMLSGVKLEGPKENETGEKYLVLSFNTEAGKEDIRMDVSELLDYYVAGDGIELVDGNAFKVKVDETTNTYLQVTTNGLAVSQAFLDKINELDNAVLAAADTTAKGYADAAQAAAIAAADTTAKGYADAAQAAAIAAADTTAKGYADAAQAAAIAAANEHANGLNTAMNTRVEALEALDHDHENKEVLDAITAEKVALWDGAEQAAKDYADDKFVTKEGFNEFEAEYEEKLNGIAAGAEVNVIEAVTVNGIDATVTDKVAEVTLTGANVALGADVTSDGEVVYESTAKLSAVLQGIQDSISVAVSGGLTGVVGGHGIEVSAVAANKQTISAKVSTAEGNLISVDENGLYAAMFYDGDDVE